MPFYMRTIFGGKVTYHILLLNYLLVLKVGPTYFLGFFYGEKEDNIIYKRMLYSALSNTGA